MYFSGKHRANTGISLEEGWPLRVPMTPLRELARSLGSPPLTPHPCGGLTPVPPSQLKKELVLPALLSRGPWRKAGGVPLTLCHAAQLFPSGSQQ